MSAGMIDKQFFFTIVSAVVVGLSTYFATVYSIQGDILLINQNATHIENRVVHLENSKPAILAVKIENIEKIMSEIKKGNEKMYEQINSLYTFMLDNRNTPSASNRTRNR